MLRRMGFDDRWVGWMDMCLETVNYSVLVNGENVGPITPGRGLRQGDPLSPYLFIICAEERAEARGDLHGVGVCRRLHLLHTTFLLMVVFYFAGLKRMKADT